MMHPDAPWSTQPLEGGNVGTSMQLGCTCTQSWGPCNPAGATVHASTDIHTLLLYNVKKKKVQACSNSHSGDPSPLNGEAGPRPLLS